MKINIDNCGQAVEAVFSDDNVRDIFLPLLGRLTDLHRAKGGRVLALLAALLPAEWYWAVQLIQLINLSGAAGDLYVTWLLCRMPKDILIQDAGVAMQVFVPAEE